MMGQHWTGDCFKFVEADEEMGRQEPKCSKVRVT